MVFLGRHIRPFLYELRKFNMQQNLSEQKKTKNITIVYNQLEVRFSLIFALNSFNFLQAVYIIFQAGFSELKTFSNNNRHPPNLGPFLHRFYCNIELPATCKQLAALWMW
jgi:hypothetical protein